MKVEETTKENCEHEYGTYQYGSLHCSDCGIKLDIITRKPIIEQKS